VTLVGPSVKMNSGGSAGQGSGTAPKLPENSAYADASTEGAELVRAPINILVPAQRQALLQRAPACAICEMPDEIEKP